MKQFSIIFLSLFLFINSAFAQETGLSGRVMDTTNLRPIVFATVSAIRKSDSLLVQHTRTSQQGKFTLNKLPADKYVLLIGHNNYIDFVDDIDLKAEDGIRNLGDYNMIQRGQVLREVIIKNTAGIKIKGDTLEYLADSFKVRQGAMVEDLLKVLPGIQVNKKGEITAMGEKVEKVLVDGEEFFGEDPTVATQNIQSKVVDKVQVFDKKSDQAAFTGFDDGQEQKTINLKLKDNMNRGEFGKVELGSDFQDRWQNQMMVNSFKNKRQMSVYGLMSSNGKTGLGWEDRNKYTGDGGNMQMDEDGGFMWNFYDSDEEEGSGRWGNGVPEGLTKAWVGGAHFADKWNENKEHLNTNYSFGRINRSKKESSITENLFPGRNFQSIDSSNSFSSRNTHRLTGKYEFMVDSSMTIIYNLNGRLSFIDGNNYSKTQNTSYSDEPISSKVTQRSNSSTMSRINNQLTVNKKLAKLGRTISLNASFNYNKNNGDGDINGANGFSVNGTAIQQIIDQKKEDELVANVLGADLTYTEPLTKKILMKLSYGISSDISHSSKTTMIQELGSTEYSTRVDSLSSDFTSNVFSQTGGLEFKYVEKKYNFTLGAKARYSIFDQQDLVRSLNYDYNRINLFPSVRFNYKFDQFRRFTFTYSGSTKQPNISQIQPVQDNSDPLNVYVGNPNLKLGYNQSLNINYFSYKVLSSRSLYAGLMLTNSFNNIATNRTLEESGRTLNTYVNLNGGYNASLWGGINTKIPKTPLEGKLNLSGSFVHTPVIINNIEGSANTVGITLTPGLSYSKEDKMYLSLDLGTTYTNTKNQLQSSRDIQFFSFAPSASMNFYLPKNFEIGTDADYLYNPAVGPYSTSFTRLIWNGYISYKMLKGKNLEWRASMNDILNQNTGYDRTTTSNFNTERNFQTLGRYWMIGMIYNFSTGPMAKAQTGPKPKGPQRRGGGGRMRH
ncbi:MAG TPA: TonB-dependent receptor [Chitinophagaceae bacterium]|nr:TonB-dependent receptor [Chitinophagaceae bacterium]